MLPELDIIEEVKDKVLILHLNGDITKASGEYLLRYKEWDQSLGNEIGGVALNFSKVDYINSSGIASLIRLARLLSKGSYPVGCYNLTFHYEKLFKMVGLLKIITIYPSEWSAVEELSKHGDGSPASN